MTIIRSAYDNEAPKSTYKTTWWMSRCDCGVEKLIRGCNVSEYSRNNLGCGCRSGKSDGSRKSDTSRANFTFKGRKHTKNSINQIKQTKRLKFGNCLNPKKNTKIEIEAKRILDSLNIKYFHQHRICGILVDFFLPEYQAVVEVDGCYWHFCPECSHGESFRSNVGFANEIQKRDSRMIEKLNQFSYHVLRLWEHDVKNFELKISKFLTQIKISSPSLLGLS